MILNLDKNFEPLGKGVDFERFDFPSGCETHIKLKNTSETGVLITCRIQSANDIVLLLLAVDALKRLEVQHIELFIPYLPFARQDRVMVLGEPLSLKVMTNLINSQGFSKVYVYDVHSDVSTALLDNPFVFSNHSFVGEVLKDKGDYLIVSPDAGAYKKIFSLCKHIGYKNEIIMCNKLRDVSNGTIRSLTVSHEDLEGKDCYIVDDICDGGGTFTMLASVLRERNAGKINLVVSHGVFSKGIDALANLDHVYCTDSFKDMPKHEKLTQIKLTNGLLY